MTSSIRPTNVARVSMLMQTDLLLNNINSVSVDLLKVQNQMSTGLKLARPSDNPTDASSIMNLDGMLERYEQYLTNVKTADSSLTETDSSLSDAVTLVQKAYSLAVGSIGKGSSERQSSATDLEGIINSLVAICNKKDANGNYIFGGQNTSEAPFEKYSSGVMYHGSSELLNTRTDASNIQAYSVDAAEAFGALSSQVVGIEDLNPTITSDTLLADLNGVNGVGIRLGTILVSDGVNTETVDLSNCATVGDVISKLSDCSAVATVGINASGTGLTITSNPANPNLTIREIGSGQTAHDLGIYDGVGGDDTITGQDVDARLTATTLVASLNGGAGIDITNGLLISNSLIDRDGTVIDLSAAETMQDILNTINNSGLGVRAEINDDGTGINVFNQLSGSELSIGENGGTTAEDLGIRSLCGETLLSDLNGGDGVHIAGNGDTDLQITDRTGATYDISLTGATTVQDVIDTINTATGGAVTASLATTGNGLVLTDNTGGSANNLSVSQVSTNGYFLMNELGWGSNLKTASSSATVLSGDDINPIEPKGLFSYLQELYTALTMSTDTDADKAISAVAPKIEESRQTMSTVHGQVGGIMKGIEQRQANIEDNILSLQTMRSDLADIDFTEAVTRYQNLYTALLANMMSGSLINNTSLLDFLQ